MKAIDYFFAARPLLHLPIWSVYLVSLNFHHQLSGETFGSVNLISLFCLTLLGAAACYLNQVYDSDTDRINRKGHFLHRGLASETDLMAGFVILSVVAVGLSVAVSPLFFLICVQLFVLGYFYSAPPLRLKDRPVAGLLANAYGIGFLCSICVFPKMHTDTVGLLGWDNPFYFAMAVGGVYLLTTIPDRAGDRATGKMTIAVLAGKGITLALGAVWFAVAAIAAWNSHFLSLFWIAVCAVVATVAAGFARSDRLVLFAAKFPILLLTLLAGWYYPPYLIFIVVLLVATRIYYTRRLNLKYPSLA